MSCDKINYENTVRQNGAHRARDEREKRDDRYSRSDNDYVGKWDRQGHVRGNIISDESMKDTLRDRNPSTKSDTVREKQRKKLSNDEEDDRSSTSLRISVTPSLPEDGEITADDADDADNTIGTNTSAISCKDLDASDGKSSEGTRTNASSPVIKPCVTQFCSENCAVWRKKCEQLEAQLNVEIIRHIDSKRRCAELQNRNAKLEETISALKEQKPGISVHDTPSRSSGLVTGPRRQDNGHFSTSSDRAKSEIPADSYKTNRPPSESGHPAMHPMPSMPSKNASSSNGPMVPDFSRPPPPVPLLMLHVEPPMPVKKRHVRNDVLYESKPVKRNRNTRWDY